LPDNTNFRSIAAFKHCMYAKYLSQTILILYNLYSPDIIHLIYFVLCVLFNIYYYYYYYYLPHSYSIEHGTDY